MRCVRIGVSKALCNFRTRAATFLTSLRAVLPHVIMGNVLNTVHHQFYRESCPLRVSTSQGTSEQGAVAGLAATRDLIDGTGKFHSEGTCHGRGAYALSM